MATDGVGASAAIRSVVEAMGDAAAVVRNGEVVAANEAYAQLVPEGLDAASAATLRALASSTAAGSRVATATMLVGTHTLEARLAVVDVGHALLTLRPSHASATMRAHVERTAKVGGFVTDLSTKRSWWTDGLYDLLEVDQKAYVPTLENNLAFYAPPSQLAAREAIRTLLETGEPVMRELQMITATGRRLWVRHVARILDEPGRSRRVAGAFVDITEQKHAELALESFFDLSRDFFMILGGEGTIERVNDSFARELGLTSAELVGRSALVLVHPDDHPIAIDGLRRALAGEAVDAIYRVVAKDGTTRRVSWSTPKHHGPHVFAVGRDVTLVEQMERELRESEERFRLSFELAPTGGLLVDHETKITRVNEAFCRMLGYRPEELLGRTFLEISHPDPDELARARELWEDVKVPGASRTIEKRFVHENGSGVWVRVSVRRVQPHDEPPYNVVVVEDIDERRRAEQALRASELRLANANEELESFSYSVSHDLRAPLRAVAGFVRALDERTHDRLDATSLALIERIERAAATMDELIRALLELAQVGRCELTMADVDLGAMARSIVDELRRTEPTRAVEVTIASDLVVRGDARLLRAAMENLLANAWKFTSKRARAHIEVGRRSDGAERWIYVRDDGAGFDSGRVGRLFKPFSRLHGSEFTGTGIGLATVARVVHRHGGQLRAHGAEDAGATFELSLPSRPSFAESMP